jgi:hypothetical protein
MTSDGVRNWQYLANYLSLSWSDLGDICIMLRRHPPSTTCQGLSALHVAPRHLRTGPSSRQAAVKFAARKATPCLPLRGSVNRTSMKGWQSDLNIQSGFVKPIGQYTYSLFARDEHAGPIFLYDTGGVQIGRIYFFTRTPSQTTLPPPSIGQDGTVELVYWVAAFTGIICMLGSESYKALVWTGDDNSRISIGS